MARTLASIMKGIQSMSEESISKDLMALIFSEFGVGKTVLTMQLAQRVRGDGDILFLDSSDGWVTLEGHPELIKSTDRMRISDPSDLIVIAKALEAGKMKSTRAKRFSVVVIDESSSVYDRMLEDYVRESMGIGPEDAFPEIEGKQYGPATMAFESLLRKFHDVADLHVLLTAHSKMVVDADTKVKELRPNFPPKAYQAIMRKVHVCAALSSTKKRNAATKKLEAVRSLQLQPSADVSAKSRISNSPLKASPEEFIELLAEWIEGDGFSQDMADADEQVFTETSTIENDVVDSSEVDDEEGEEAGWDEEMRREELEAMERDVLLAYIESEYGWEGLGTFDKEALVNGTLDYERPA